MSHHLPGASDAVLEVRVTGLENDVRGINQKLDSVITSLAGIGKTNWPTIFMAAAVAISIVAYMGSLTLEPIKQNNQYLMVNVVPRAEHEEKWRANDRTFEDIHNRIIESKAAAKVDSQYVQNQVDELKRAMGGIYGAHDAMQELQARLQRLEERSQRRAETQN